MARRNTLVSLVTLVPRSDRFRGKEGKGWETEGAILTSHVSSAFSLNV